MNVPIQKIQKIYSSWLPRQPALLSAVQGSKMSAGKAHRPVQSITITFAMYGITSESSNQESESASRD